MRQESGSKTPWTNPRFIHQLTSVFSVPCLCGVCPRLQLSPQTGRLFLDLSHALLARSLNSGRSILSLCAVGDGLSLSLGGGPGALDQTFVLRFERLHLWNNPCQEEQRDTCLHLFKKSFVFRFVDFKVTFVGEQPNPWNRFPVCIP